MPLEEKSQVRPANPAAYFGPPPPRFSELILSVLSYSLANQLVLKTIRW